MFVCVLGCSEAKRKIQEQVRATAEHLGDKAIDTVNDKAAKKGDTAVDNATGEDQKDADANKRDTLKGKDGE